MPPRHERSLSSRVGGLLAAALVITGLYFGREVLMPIALSVLLAFLLLPVVTRIERLAVGRAAAVVLTMIVAGAVLAGVGWLVAYQFAEFGRDLPAYKQSLLSKAGAIRTSTEAVKSVTKTIEEIDEELRSDEGGDKRPPSTEATPKADAAGDERRSRASAGSEDEPSSKNRSSPVEPTWWQKVAAPFGVQAERPQPVEVKVSPPPASPLAQAKEWLGPLLAPFLTAGLVIVLVAFFLYEREDLRNRVVELFGASKLYATTEAIHDAEMRVTRYLRAQFLLNASMGCAVALAMWAFGLPAPLLWGVLAMLLRFVPYVGPAVALALPVLLSLAVFDGWARPLGVLGFFLAAELIWNNVLEPFAYGNSIGISQTGVILSAIFWTWLWGPVGLVLAMPLTVCVVILGRYVPQMQFISVLLRDRSALSVEERIYQRLLAYDEFEANRIAGEHVEADALERSLDETMIGALCLVERDRQAGVIDEDRSAYVCRAVRDITADLVAGAAAEAEVPDAIPDSSVLCVPVGDAVDDAANEILFRLLARVGLTVESIGVGRLAAEVVEAVERTEVGVVVLSVLPPVSVSDGRYLCRSLRARFPQLPIVVGIWRGDAGGPMSRRLLADGGTCVVNSLVDAVSRVRQYAWRSGIELAACSDAE